MARSDVIRTYSAKLDNAEKVMHGMGGSEDGLQKVTIQFRQRLSQQMKLTIGEP